MLQITLISDEHDDLCGIVSDKEARLREVSPDSNQEVLAINVARREKGIHEALYHVLVRILACFFEPSCQVVECFTTGTNRIQLAILVLS